MSKIIDNTKTDSRTEISAHMALSKDIKVVNAVFFHYSKNIEICYQVFADIGMLWNSNSAWKKR